MEAEVGLNSVAVTLLGGTDITKGGYLAVPQHHHFFPGLLYNVLIHPCIRFLCISQLIAIIEALCPGRLLHTCFSHFADEAWRKISAKSYI